MSIRQRLEDTVILDGIGRKDGALLSVLVAVAATSRLRYPAGTKSSWKPGKEMGDSEAFQTFLGEESESVYGKGLRLKLSAPCPDPEDPSAPPMMLSHPAIMYKYVRCELVHAAKLPHTIEFQRSSDGALCASYVAAENKFVFSDNWVSRLIRVVVLARENDGQFEEERHASTILARQKLPFMFTRQNIVDFQLQFGDSKQEVNGGFEATFCHRF
ncbi:MAG TPA: hypothetical protein VMS17_20820 [Gemmataceae bacterium]|nr:hypothetical protein [Gemmataceae bacterium]